MSMFEVVYKKSHFLRQFMKLTIKVLPRFACKANRDSESGFRTTLGPVLTQRIH